MGSTFLEFVENAEERLVVGYERDFVQWDFAYGGCICAYEREVRMKDANVSKIVDWELGDGVLPLGSSKTHYK